MKQNVKKIVCRVKNAKKISIAIFIDYRNLLFYQMPFFNFLAFSLQLIKSDDTAIS